MVLVLLLSTSGDIFFPVLNRCGVPLKVSNHPSYGWVNPCPVQWNAYRNWLRLQVIHIDAAQVLAGHVSKLPEPVIPFKILSTSTPDKKMHPWKDLLRNQNYFPEIPSEDSAIFCKGAH
jgi:hypothetical protein